MRWHVGSLWAAREHRLGYWLLVWVLALLAALVFSPHWSR